MWIHILLCIGSYLLCKTMNLQVISMGSFLTEIEVTEEVLGIREVLEVHEDGKEARTLMMSLDEVVEVSDLATTGLEREKAAAMIG